MLGAVETLPLQTYNANSVHW